MSASTTATLAPERASLTVARIRRVPRRDPARESRLPAPDQRNHLIGGQQVDEVRDGRLPNTRPRDQHERLVCNGLSSGRRQRHPKDAYFSPSWTAFQADRGRYFSVIVDGVSD
jgi:hypothetical protein